MVCSYEPEVVAPIELDDFFEELDRIYDPAFPASFIAASARLLQRLSSNRLLLIDYIERCGGVFRAAETFNIPQSFVLASRSPFVVRVNIWNPLSGEVYRDRERNLYSYDLAHNHDFRFLTVGHLGPGYVTEICEVDPDAIAGVPGEPVALNELRTEILSEGRVLYFEPFTDVHDQHPPERLSVSINLVLSLENGRGEQYEFDLKTASLLGPVTQGAVERTRACLRFAEYFADADTTEIVRRMAASASAERVRKEAAQALPRLAAPGAAAEQACA
jgi:hypothetical protein